MSPWNRPVRQPLASRRQCRTPSGAPAILFFTSGSTGAPKGVVQSCPLAMLNPARPRRWQCGRRMLCRPEPPVRQRVHRHVHDTDGWQHRRCTRDSTSSAMSRPSLSTVPLSCAPTSMCSRKSFAHPERGATGFPRCAGATPEARPYEAPCRRNSQRSRDAHWRGLGHDRSNLAHRRTRAPT
jgi:hypothetical protein